MMRYRLSSRAKNDKLNIFNYYRRYASIKIAMRIIADIDHTIRSLTFHPYLGHLEPSLEEFPQSFRCLVDVPNYKIIYWVENNTVKIATLFDCRQQPQDLYRIINSQSDWICEPPVEYKTTE